MRKFIALFAFLSFVFLLVGCIPGQSDITVVFETNGGEALDNMVISATDSALVLPTPVRQGYTFEGWYLDPDFNTEFSLIGLVQAGETLTLYAKWSEIAETTYVTVTFNSNGGTSVPQQTVLTGGQATLPTAPTKQGYTFIGWYSDTALTTAFVFTAALSGDITLHAKWDVVLLTVTFYDDDEITVLKTESVAYGGAATAPTAPTKASTAQHAFIFNVWDKAFNNVTTHLNVYATYTQTVRSYTVTFYNDDGTTVLKTESVPYGGAATAPSTPTKASTAQHAYAFNAWDTAFDNITGDLTVTATYTQTVRSYTVTFYDDDGTTILKTESVLYGGAATAPTSPTKTSTEQHNFVFDGWDKVFNTITGDLSVFATYLQEVRYYAVIYITEKEGVFSTHTVDDVYVYLSIDIDAYEPTPIEGYIFDGWYYDDFYTIPFDNTPLEAVTTLYGRFIAMVDDSVSISTIYTTKPVDPIKVTGVVYAIIEDSTDTFVFIQDETGYIFFIENDLVLEIGDLITMTAKYAVIPSVNISFLTDSQDIIILVPKRSLRAPESLSLFEINDLDMYHWSSFGKDLVTSGTLQVHSDGDDDHYYLMDYLSNNYLAIHPESITDDLIAAVGQRVIIGGLLMPAPDMNSIVLYFTEIQQPLTILNPTDQELLDELIMIAEMYLNEMVFYSGQTVPAEMFEAPPIFDVIVTFETFGPNASLFDWNTYTFAIVETEQIIDIRIHLTLGTLEETLEIVFIVKPIEVITIAQFLAGDNMESYIVQGVLLHIASEHDEPNIIADDTGFLLVMSQIDAEIGDLIIISGMRNEMNGNVFMVGTPNVDVLNILDFNQPNPLVATPVALSDIADMDPSSFTYIEIEGTLHFDPNFLDFPMIHQDPYHVMVFPLGGSYDTLWSINGLHVTLRGFLFGIQDPVDGFITFVIFINYPGDLVIPEQTDQETADMITNYITSLNLGELRAFDYLEMPSFHPLRPEIMITWTPTGDTLNYFDPSLGKILDLLDEAILTFDVTFSVGDINVTLSLEYVAYPKDLEIVYYKTLLQIHQEFLKDKVLVRGVIYYILPNEGFFIFDETARIYVSYYSTSTLEIGDLVEFETYVVNYGFGQVKRLSVFDDITTLDTMQVTLLPEATMLSEASDYDYSQWQYYGLNVTLTGFITEMHGTLYLYDPFSDTMVWLYATTYDYADFTDFIGKHVRLGALLIGFDEELSYLLYNPHDVPVELFNSSDEDLVDMLLEMARSYLDGMVFLSGQSLDEQMVTPPDIFNATVEFITFGLNSSLLDFVTLEFAEVTEEKVIDVRITVTIGTITKDTEIILILKPIQIVDVIDVIYGTSETLYVISGVILFMDDDGEDDMMIIADQTGMVLIMGSIDAKIGDHVTVAGYRFEMDGLVLLVGMPTLYLIEVIDHNMPNPLSATPMTLEDIDLLDPETFIGSPYIEISGQITSHDFFEEGVILTVGDKSLIVFPPNDLIYDVLLSAMGLNVTLKGYLFPMRGDAPFDFYLVFINYPGDILATTNDDADVIAALTAYIEMLNQKDLYTGMYLDMPDTHPFLVVDINWTSDTETTALIDPVTHEILTLSEPTMLSFTVSFTVGALTIDLDIFYMAYPTGYEIPLFEPGYHGTVVSLNDPEIEGQFPGLFIYAVGHEWYYGGTTRSKAELRFPMPYEYGFTHYTFETYNNSTELWETLYINDELVVANWDNYTFYFNVATLIRLRGHSGDPIDLVSNSVTITWTGIETGFQGWFMDESMMLTGVMLPFVGRGIEVDHPTVYDYDSSDYVPEGLGLSYQWYRINPFTFEQILIPGATNQLYETTIDDAGYQLMVRISGDEVNVGGYLQIISFSDTLIPVFGFVSQLSDQGFTLNLSHFVPIEDIIDYLEIYGGMGVLEITDIQQGGNAAIYHITVDLTNESDLWINLDALTWTLSSANEYHMGMMQGLFVEIIETK